MTLLISNKVDRAIDKDLSITATTLNQVMGSKSSFQANVLFIFYANIIFHLST